MPINVLVIDDSAYNRFTLKSILESMPGVNVVGTAVDGLDGYRQAIKSTPDLIMLDLEMPNMDGFTFLRHYKVLRNTPVLAVSGRKRSDDREKALELGAFDFIEKPTMEASESLRSIKGEILKKIRTAPLGLAERAKSPALKRSAGSFDAVLIGASTGGPRAVASVLRSIPAGTELAFVAAIHMPGWLTNPFAERLRMESGVDIRVAKDFEKVDGGAVYIAPGGRNISFEAIGSSVFIRLEKRGEGDVYAPSINRMFSSGAAAWGSRVLGIVMTGMGNDGSEGIIDIKKRGGYVVAESSESSVIFSMPEAAISTGMVDEVLSKDMIGEALKNRSLAGS